MNDIFNWCVQLLLVMADALNLTYEEINVIIFCFIWPAITIFLFIKTIQNGKQRKA